MAIHIGKKNNGSTNGMRTLTSKSKPIVLAAASVAEPVGHTIKKVAHEVERVLDQA